MQAESVNWVSVPRNGIRMERIKIKINKIGRVANSVIEIAPMMIFSGESGMGKSYLALLAHYFYDVLIISDRVKRLEGLFETYGYDYNRIAGDFEDEGKALTLTKRQIEQWMEKDAINYLRFMLNSERLEGDIEVTLPSSVSEEITISYTKEKAGLVNSEAKEVVLGLGEIGFRVTQSAINDANPFAAILSAYLTERLYGHLYALRSTFNMPPSRGPVLSENVTGNSGMYKDFIADVNEMSNVLPNSKDKPMSLMAQLHEIMEGEVKKEDGRYVYLTDGVDMPISAAASSIREIAPLQLLASKVSMGQTALLIEEPEAHLHPNKQRMMADVVGCIHQTGAYVHLTTHSDYFLRRINELILFQRYVNSHSEEEVARLSERTGIRTSFSIDGSKVVAYIVVRQQDGTSQVVEQDIKHGVPFTSFNEAVRESMRVGDILEEALDL